MSYKIDKLIAEHVMEGDIRPYSTKIRPAWVVMEELSNLTKYSLVIGRNPYTDREEYCVMYMSYDCLEIFSAADTATMAICLAALKAKGIEID